MKKILLFLVLFNSVVSFGQTSPTTNINGAGINTQEPKATLHVVATDSSGKVPEGIIAPRMTGDALNKANFPDSSVVSKYGLDQDGALVFVTEVPSIGKKIDQTSNIDSRGYYYFDATQNKWMKATSGNFVTTEVGSLSCDEANFSNTNFIKGVAYSGTFTMPYIGGNGLAYEASSFTSNGLIFSLPAGVLANGSGNLVYNVSGTPDISGVAYIPFTFAGKMCIKTINVALPVANVGNIDCNQAVLSSTSLSLGVSYTGTLSIPYTDGNGGSYEGTTFTQDGLTFVLVGGNLATGNGTLVYTVNGMPKISGIISLPIEFEDKSCYVSLNITEIPMIDSLNCIDTEIVFNPNTFYQGVYYTGTLKLQYFGGNEASYPASTFTHNGLTFTLPTGTLTYGFGTLTYQVSGTPISSGEQMIDLNFLGITCTKKMQVSVKSTISDLTCSSITFNPTTITKGIVYSGTLTVPYTGGNGGAYPASTFTHNGLVFSLPAGTLSGSVEVPTSGNLVYNVTGVPTVGGNVNIPVSIFNKTCTKNIDITIPVGSIGSLNCNEAIFSPAVLSEGVAYTGTLRIPYTGSNGGNYAAPIAVVQNGLTFKLVAGVLDNTSGVLEYQVTGTPTISGTSNVTLTFLTKTCNVSVNVTSPASIDNLICDGTEFLPARFYTSVNNNGTLTVFYSGGNGAAYPTSTFTRNGLTFKLRPGVLTNSTGSLIYDVTGIVTGVAATIDEPPIKIGYLDIPVEFLNKTCIVTMTVVAPPITGINCEDFVSKKSNTKSKLSPYPTLNNSVSAGTTLIIEYIGGNGISYPAGEPFILGGLTFVLRAGTLTPNGTLVYDVTGKPTQLSIKVPIKFYGYTCDFYIGLQDDEHLAIKGRIWKRHNLGVDTSLDADDLKIELVGNYYQWSKKAPVATRSSVIGTWNATSVTNSDNFWSDTVRSITDPCPSGFKVPSKVDGDALITYLASSSSSNGQGTKFKLSNGSNYQLTFAITGGRNNNDSSLYGYDYLIYSWLSSHVTTPNSTNAYYLVMNSRSVNNAYRSYGMPVRCISVPEN